MGEAGDAPHTHTHTHTHHALIKSGANGILPWLFAINMHACQAMRMQVAVRW